MLKRIISITVSVIVTLSMLTGCGSSSKTNTAGETTGAGAEVTAEQTTAQTSVAEEPKPVSIVVADWPKETDETGLKDINAKLETFKKLYPHITIVPEQWTYDVNSFLPKAASGQLPTQYNTWFTETNKIINAGYACDITNTMKEYGYDKALNQDMLKLATKDGKYYGLPTSGYAVGMWYNVNLFKKAGLVDDKGVPKFPKTYEELAQTAQIIKDKTGKAGFFFPGTSNQGGWLFMNIAWAYGAEFEKQVDGKWKAVFNSPEAVAALQYIKDLKWKYNALQSNILTDVGEMFKLIGTDQVGMTFGLTDWMNVPVNDFKMSKDNLAMSVLPAGPKGNVALLGGNLMMFSPQATPEQLDACFKWNLVNRGLSDKVDEASIKGLEDRLKTEAEKLNIVGPHGIRVWTNQERIAAEDAIYNKYKNVNMDLWNDYLNNVTGIRPEEPINCQELYKALDVAIQAVVTDKNADPKKILDKVVIDFQRDYLDKAQ